jgi:tetratricopeptide (TPR) repeat protein
MKLALTMLVLSAGWVAAQDRMADTLRKAVVEEESQHNLAAAVQDYQAVVAQFDEGRKTAATALFRLAECYRQQGKKDQAIAAYQRVVQEFADQSKLAEQSRTVLASSYKIAPKAVAGRAEEASRAEAQQRYRALLLQEINVANDELKRVQNMVALGVISPNDTASALQQKLKLERELAAFDMGIMPTETTKGGR